MTDPNSPKRVDFPVHSDMGTTEDVDESEPTANRLTEDIRSRLLNWTRENATKTIIPRELTDKYMPGGI